MYFGVVRHTQPGRSCDYSGAVASNSVIASVAKQSRNAPAEGFWIASSQELLAMTEKRGCAPHLNSASTTPSPSSSIRTLSPAFSHSVFTRLPVSTSCPA
ncbi:hypothetical protein ACVIWV_001626 [Bradyrhizobium diazoefficiens]|jgi:hypothetical protein